MKTMPDFFSYFLTALTSELRYIFFTHIIDLFSLWERECVYYFFFNYINIYIKNHVYDIIHKLVIIYSTRICTQHTF